MAKPKKFKPKTKSEVITSEKKRQRYQHGAFTGFGLSKERDYFVENASMLIGSGMPILEVMDAIGQELKLKRMKQLVLEIKEDIEAGNSFSRALQNTGIFSAHVISLIRIGEESGKLTENLKVVSLEQDKERQLKGRLRSAMMYPVFVMGLTVIIAIGIAWFILPKLAAVFGQLDLELPLVTKMLIAVGLFLSQYGIYAVPTFIALILVVFYFGFIFPRTKFIGQNLLFLVPGIKTLIQEVELARFGYLLGTLLSAGVLITDALSSVEAATSFPRYRKLYKFLGQRVAEGNSFRKSFALYPKTHTLIPISIQRLITAGERSGNLSPTLIKIGENFEAKTENTTKDLTVILEPILLVLVWLGVVAVALAVILPIYNLVGNLNNNV